MRAPPRPLRPWSGPALPGRKPTLRQIRYKRRSWKYELVERFEVETGLRAGEAFEISGGYVQLTATGRLRIAAGYAWDGASGPTRDTHRIMRGALIHDALYQLFRETRLDRERFRDDVDELFREICIEDGMSRLRASYVYHAVRLFGSRATRQKPNGVLSAPANPAE